MATKYVLVEAGSIKPFKKKARHPRQRTASNSMFGWENQGLLGGKSNGGMMDMPKFDLMGSIQKRRDPKEQLKALQREERMERIKGKIDILRAAKSKRQALQRKKQLQQVKGTIKSIKGAFGKLKPKKKGLYD